MNVAKGTMRKDIGIHRRQKRGDFVTGRTQSGDQRGARQRIADAVQSDQ
ncbi:MAG: hypothetical protein M3160_03910 [Candidatus Eremiobacteraeota bacterium]|nr:hypothetical protein [Candidatus Eremiobacteraeota bacterium]